ncbi:MAG: hypothetical protein J6C82_03110 [Clostridia bacterium]|nr:hypothetical protein [Clostridia bacterium]
MKKIHYIIIPSAVIASIFVFAACTRKNNSDEMRESRGQQEVISREENIEESPMPTALSEPTATYCVRLEDKTLTLYEISKDEYNVIKAINIDTSYYPPDDIMELNRGITAYSKESGYEILENFTN